MISNLVHQETINSNSTLPVPTEDAPEVLFPDLRTQVKSFMDLPAPKKMPAATLFVVSFGFWDVYDFADSDLQEAKPIIDSSVSLLFSELNTLYDHFVDTYHTMEEEIRSGETNSTVPHKLPSFRVIIPKLFDPTLLPGWILERPLPVPPSSIAEEHKNAVNLTARWNSQMELKMTSWINNPHPEKSTQNPQNATAQPLTSPPDNRKQDKSDDPSVPKAADKSIEKDVIYYDLPSLLLDLLIEHQLEDQGLHDASGLGQGESPFQSVSLPCLHEGESDDVDGLAELNGLLV